MSAELDLQDQYLVVEHRVGVLGARARGASTTISGNERPADDARHGAHVPARRGGHAS